MKFLVSATQLITQDVQFIIDFGEHEGDADEAKAIVANGEPDERKQLYDARDEVYLRDIVTSVRPATEEESK